MRNVCLVLIAVSLLSLTGLVREVRNRRDLRDAWSEERSALREEADRLGDKVSDLTSEAAYYRRKMLEAEYELRLCRAKSDRLAAEQEHKIRRLERDVELMQRQLHGHWRISY